MDAFEVVTLLSVKDEATAALQRFVAMLREVQAQVDASLAGLRAIRNAIAPSTAALARQREALATQRESLGLIERQAVLQTTITAETTKQAEAVVAARRTSLGLAREELGVQRSMRASIVPSFKRLGGNLFWGGAGTIGALTYATEKAMGFNQTALETDMALGGYTRPPAQRARDILALQNAAFAGSEATGFFGAQDILEGLKKAASAGARPLVEKMGMGVFTAIVPALSRYMDVMGRLKGESADQAAMEAIQTAHQFGAYNAVDINRILNAQAALALIMPDTMSKAVTTGAYVASTGLTLAGMAPSAILALIATADQSGIGKGRAGARLKDYIEAIAIRQSKAREKAKTLLGTGGAIDPKTASLDIEKSFDILIADRKRMGPQAFRDTVRTAFGAQGDIIAAMFGDPKKVKMFEANKRVIEQSLERGDLTTIQNLLKGGPAGQQALAWIRLQNDIIKFGQYGIPIALKFFAVINPELKRFGDWMTAHPDDAKRLFDNLFRVGEAMLALSAAFKVIVGVSGAIKIVQALGGAFRGVAMAARGLSAAAPGASAAVGNVALALRGLAGAGAAFLASPFGKAFSAAGVLLGTTSFEPQGDARKQLIQMYGYDYWRYLKGRHPGTNPYSFNRGDGDLTPQQYHALHSAPLVRQILAVEERRNTISPGQRFDQEILKRALNPVVTSLTGGVGGRSVVDTISYGSHTSSDKIVNAINANTAAVVAALASLGINITIPATQGNPAQTFSGVLGKPITRTGGGVPHHPFKPASWNSTLNALGI
jgi:hypothetical protein